MGTYRINTVHISIGKSEQSSTVERFLVFFATLWIIFEWCYLTLLKCVWWFFNYCQIPNPDPGIQRFWFKREDSLAFCNIWEGPQLGSTTPPRVLSPWSHPPPPRKKTTTTTTQLTNHVCFCELLTPVPKTFGSNPAQTSSQLSRVSVCVVGRDWEIFELGEDRFRKFMFRGYILGVNKKKKDSV